MRMAFSYMFAGVNAREDVEEDREAEEEEADRGEEYKVEDEDDKVGAWKEA